MTIPEKEEGSAVKAIPSATVVLIRDNPRLEVLLLQRNPKIKFHGGSWVFPGGKVDQNDLPKNCSSIDVLSEYEKREVYRVAAIRETKEEAGIDLTAEHLHLCSTWLTPMQMPKRFDAWFYLAICPDQDILIDDGEIKDFQWLEPTSAMDLQRRGELSLPPPTYVTLWYLSQHQSAEEAIIKMPEQLIHFIPKIVGIENGFVSLYQEDAGYSEADVCTQGKRHRLVKQGEQFQYINEFSHV